MEDYKKLVNRLRDEPKDSRKAVLSIYDLCIDAAYAIEILLDKLKYAEGERDAVTRHMIELEQEVFRLKSRLAAYEELMERWKLRSIEEADRIFQRVNALGGTDLMAQYRDIGSIDHFRDLLQAEQDGRLVVLLCKVGDHVWADGREAIVVWFFGYETERYLHAQFYDNMQYIDIPFTEIGKTVFLTREEAEAALVLKGGEV